MSGMIRASTGAAKQNPCSCRLAIAHPLSIERETTSRFTNLMGAMLSRLSGSALCNVVPSGPRKHDADQHAFAALKPLWTAGGLDEPRKHGTHDTHEIGKLFTRRSL